MLCGMRVSVGAGRRALKLAVPSGRTARQGRGARCLTSRAAISAGTPRPAASIAEDGALHELLALGARPSEEQVLDVLSRWSAPDAWTVTHWLSHLGKVRRPQSALALLQALQRHQDSGLDDEMTLNTFHFNAALGALEKAGWWREAVKLLSEMLEDPYLKPTAVTYGSVIGACARSGQWERAIHLLGEASQLGLRWTSSMCTSAISACERSGKAVAALQILVMMDEHSTRKDSHVYNAAMAACSRGSLWRRSLGLFDDMALNRLGPDIISFNALLSTCARASEEGLRMKDGSDMKATKWQEAIQIFHEVKNLGLPQDTFLYNTMIDCLGCAHRWELALSAFDEMSGHVKQDGSTFVIAMTAIGKGLQWELSLGLLETMKKQMLRPNAIAFNSAIGACKRGAAWSAGLTLLQEMHDLSLKRDALSFNAALGACSQAKMWAHALQLFAEMKEDQIRPTVATYSALRDGLQGVECISSLYEEISAKAPAKR